MPVNAIVREADVLPEGVDEGFTALNVDYVNKATSVHADI